MKICLVTPRFTISGVPLAQLRFARALAVSGHTVELIIGHVESGLSVPPAPGVKITILDKIGVRRLLLPLALYFRRHQPDVVFSAEDHLTGVVLLAAILSGSKAKISGSSRVSPFDTYSNKALTKGWVFKQLMRAVMWRANALTCVSKDMVDQYRTIFKAAPHVNVYNIIDDRASRQKLAEPVDHEWLVNKTCPVIIAAGTLTGRKGFKILVEAAGIVSSTRQIRLMILGEGYRRPELEAQARGLGIADRVWMPGSVPNALKYFAHSDVFVLSSYAEGLPNVLVEAMLCGCTPVATDCPTGPRELMQDGRCGYLVPVGDPVAMAKGIEEALDKPIDKARLAEATRPFKEEAVIARHFEVLGLPPECAEHQVGVQTSGV